jgi:hypothetical protein
MSVGDGAQGFQTVAEQRWFRSVFRCVLWQRLAKEERHLALGMVVVKVPRDFRGRKWSLADADVVRRCELTTCREISVSVELHPDFSYLVVPFTSMPEQEGPFILRTFSSAPVRLHSSPPSLVPTLSSEVSLKTEPPLAWHTASKTDVIVFS